jgi:hypothetical protein
MSPNDLGCVKTHTSPKCRKYGSPSQYRSASAQYYSALMRGNCAGIFYALGDCWIFHTAKTHSCQSTVNFVVAHNEPHYVAACGRRPLGGSVRQRRATSRKPAKTQHGSTRNPKRNKVPTAARPAGSTLSPASSRSPLSKSALERFGDVDRQLRRVLVSHHASRGGSGFVRYCDSQNHAAQLQSYIHQERDRRASHAGVGG